MTLEALREDARTIPLPSARAAAEFCEKCDLLAAKVTATLKARDDIDQLIGPGNLDLMANNLRNQASFLGAMMTAYSPGGYVATIVWAMNVYRRRGFQPGYWPAQGAAWNTVLREELSDDTYYQVLPLFAWVGEHRESLWAVSTIHIEQRTTVSP
jgi:hypothetical protein